ncbi:protein-glutamine gamma-glutamyltransferase 5-like isoform X1 [Rhinatrema bivittatum]|uniref:protein-glutamine gamma-glutamyltransferase 5-like isoform X1 n=1 Tax=Rhinatrema bivittatum TaxID=194408 RepID=UPI00112ED7FD|nr:protein-glutamine gamma-glutamyltransferase 5-like isoform X1 [Rhinatrema bivittatum]
MAGGLEVAFSDLQCDKNNLKHHTADISTSRLILRRGEYFVIKIQLKPRGFQAKTDQITFTAETGPWPEEPSGTKVTFPLASSGKPKNWGAFIESSGPDSLLIAVITPGNAIIGQYTLKVQVSPCNKPTTYLLGQFVLLFNPWCPEDDVYLGDENQREEYVMNEHGFVYQGNPKWIHPRPWNFAQFEEDIVDICMKLLDKNLNFLNDAFKDLARRNDPVYVSRVVCAMINCNDDAGVLQGNWSGKYDNGISPSTWNGSITILRDWMARECQPVKYGQCWVFAAVMCTVMRCLGIPSRVITNFDSAHDTNANLCVDECYDNYGKKIPNASHDSIWNFHVWTECWMERRDLPPGYGGWQVLDPTPQEKSNGIFCCGPASVKAIKEGDVDISYDAPFVYSMVNADCISWIVSRSRKEKYFRDTKTVGSCITTKSVGSDDRQDITDNYKYKEGSLQERKAYQKAIARLKQPRPITGTSGPKSPSGETQPLVGSGSLVPDSEGAEYPNKPRANKPLKDAQISLKLKLSKSPQIGENIEIVLVAGNLQHNSMKLKLNLCGQSMQHSGQPLHEFWKDSMYIALGPSEEKLIQFTIPYSLYGKHVDDNNLIQITAVGEDNQTWQKVLVVKDITLAIPDVIINILGQAVVNQQVIVKCTFVNPLSEPAENCMLMIEGTGLIKRLMKIRIKPLKPRETSCIHFYMYPFKSGQKQLQVILNANKSNICKGYKNITVARGY